MIIITLKDLADFLSFFVNNRLSEHVFYEIRSHDGETTGKRQLFLHFLGSMGTLTVLFQAAMDLPVKMDLDAFLTGIRSRIAVDGIILVHGTIREIYLSLS